MIMKKIIGNAFFCVVIYLFFNASTIFADAKLSVTDMQGRKIQQAYVGVPFTLKLHLDKMANDSKEPEIEGLDRDGFSVGYQGTSSTIKNISGQVTVERTFSYTVRIDKEGEFTIGPATIRIQGGIIESNKVKITVSPASEQVVSEAQNGKSSLEIIINQNSVYVGQKIYLTIIAKLEQDANISKLSQPDLKDFDIYNVSGPIKEEQDGILVSKWVYEIFPKRAGKIIIPALVGEVQVQDMQHNSFFAGFFNTYNTKQIVSNSLTLDVKNLPVSKNNQMSSDIVGKFSKFTASVDKDSAPVSDGIIYTLSLSGEGDFAKINFDSLDLPEGLRYFKSKSDITRNSTSGNAIVDTKKFEYIIQGLVLGEFTIPAQEFSFFDPSAGKYKTLKTDDITVNIIQGAHSQSSTGELHNESGPGPECVNDECPESKEILGGRFFAILPDISWHMFIILTFAPVIVLLAAYISIRARRTLKYKYFIILLRNRRARKKLDIDIVYKNIVEIVAFKYKLKLCDVSHEYLKSLFSSPQDLQKWHTFLDDLYKAKFDKSDANVQAKKDLIKQSFVWLKKLSS